MNKLFLLSMCSLMTFTVCAKKVSIMSYNIQNLFDTVHDKGKNDYTYLPVAVKNASPTIQKICKSLAQEWYIKSCLETDWNKEALNSKMKALAKVIMAYNQKKGADIVAFQEVENLNVLTMLTTNYLSKEYKYISLIEGPDSRGIDTAVISKYPIIKETIHNINLTGIAKKTRAILQVDIKLNNKIITVFSNHWPSQANPSEARLEAAKKLEEISLSLNSNLIVAVGDFNTLENETPNPIEYTYNHFVDARLVAIAKGKKIAKKGTHWYKGHWSSLDKFLVFKKSRRAKPLYRSYNVFARDWMLFTKKWEDRDSGEVTYYKGVPMPFSEKNMKGYSDHLPIVMKFRI